ncbi:MAG: TonB-dependent receptor, partial [Chlamydiia bacterium]|nr:TonB-dependent receptor [Chlamydiia bacterium]
ISYSDWFIKMFDDIRLKNSSAKYHDVTAKFTQIINEKSIVSLSAYYSADSFNLALDSTFKWSTKNISLNWIQNHNKKAKSTFTLANSNYTSGVDYSDELRGFNYSNGINVVTFNYKFNYKLSPKINLLAGTTNNYNIINPGESYPSTEISSSDEKVLNKQKSIESAIFLGTDISINDRLSINVGLRYDNFMRFGEDYIYSLDYNNLDGRTASVTDTTFYGKSDIISQYGGLQPRLSVRYMLTENTSIKLGYGNIKQYIHQISSTTIPSPVDFWITSGPNLKPQIGNQVSLGYFQNFSDSFLETSIEAFYKKTDNSIDYIAGVDLHLNDNIDAALTQGNAYSYGLEFLLKRTEGKFNGWLAYTFSRSYQEMKGESPELAINDGEKYPSMFDQPHQLTLVLNYRISNLIVLSSNFTYNSGRPITVPISKYSYGSVLSVNNYSKRNSYRMPDYHRLDLSITFYSQKKPNSKFNSEFIFSIYNVYARKNAYAISFDNNGQAYKTYILGTILPSISYIIKFE